MMSTRAMIAAGILALALPAAAAVPVPSDQLRSALEAAVERQEISAAVLGVYADGRSNVLGFGRIGPDDPGTPAGDTGFEIGSITKVFTALLAQAEVDAGRLEWDAPLSSLLDVDFRSDAVAAITPRELATHTSGLPRLPGNWHNGGTGGYSSFLAFRPATRTGLVILTASTEAARITELGLAEMEGRTLEADIDLSAYPGTYRLAEGMLLRIFVQDGRLFGQATGQAAFPLAHSAEDTFDFEAAGIRITFAREDGAAHELTLMQGGHTTVAPRVAAELGPREHTEIAVDPAALAEYAGRYELAPGAIITIEARDGQLYAQLTGQPAYPVFPYEKDRFFYRVVDAQLEFRRDDGGKVSGLVLHQAGARPARRID